MTNLLEKALLVGFGIFTLIIFLMMISPFLQEIYEYKKENREENVDNNDKYSIYDDKKKILLREDNFYNNLIELDNLIHDSLNKEEKDSYQIIKTFENLIVDFKMEIKLDLSR